MNTEFSEPIILWKTKIFHFAYPFDFKAIQTFKQILIKTILFLFSHGCCVFNSQLFKKIFILY